MTTIETRPDPDLAVQPEVIDLLVELGVRYEVVDGSVVVMPSTTFGHEDLSSEVLAQLRMQAPQGISVLGSNYNFYYARPASFFLCADVLVARTDDCGPKGIDAAPLLMVETLSPGSRRHDLLVKRDIYAAAGVPSYWVIDPVAVSLTVRVLRDGEYVETVTVSDHEVLAVTEPFPAHIRLKRTAVTPPTP